MNKQKRTFKEENEKQELTDIMKAAQESGGFAKRPSVWDHLLGTPNSTHRETISNGTRRRNTTPTKGNGKA